LQPRGAVDLSAAPRDEPVQPVSLPRTGQRAQNRPAGVRGPPVREWSAPDTGLPAGLREHDRQPLARRAATAPPVRLQQRPAERPRTRLPRAGADAGLRHRFPARRRGAAGRQRRAVRMRVRDGLERVARAAAARPLPVLLAVAALALGGGLLALTLQPSTGAETLASRGSAAFKATDDLHRRFGDDAVLVLIDEHVPNLVLTPDLGRTLRLEGCLGGHVPHGARPYGGTHSACAGLARLKPIRLVYGPGTFLNESVNAVQAQVGAELAQVQQAVTNAVAAARAQAIAAGLDAAAQQQAVA